MAKADEIATLAVASAFSITVGSVAAEIATVASPAPDSRKFAEDVAATDIDSADET
jgi:hypothetical protein